MANNTLSSEQIIASGGLFLAKTTKRFLFLLRTQGRTAGTWGLVGGRKEPSDATPFEALKREIQEEIGIKSTILSDIEEVGMVGSHHVMLGIVDKQFNITNLKKNENDDYGWFTEETLPSPMHPR